MESFASGLNGRKLAVAMTVQSRSLTLKSIPADLPAGRYPFKIDLEVVTGAYPGQGLVFGDLQRGLDGTTPRAHLVDSTVLHPIRGATLSALTRAARESAVLRYVRPPAQRAYIASNFN